MGNLAPVGLLVVRVGLGLMFMAHGWPKIKGGPDMWVKLGGAMENLGISFLPAFWGFMAALAEFGGGLCLALGILFTPACGFLAFTMLIAALHHLSKGDGIMGSSHAIEAAIVFVGLILTGPGTYRFGRKG